MHHHSWSWLGHYCKMHVLLLAHGFSAWCAARCVRGGGLCCGSELYSQHSAVLYPTPGLRDWLHYFLGAIRQFKQQIFVVEAFLRAWELGKSCMQKRVQQWSHKDSLHLQASSTKEKTAYITEAASESERSCSPNIIRWKKILHPPQLAGQAHVQAASCLAKACRILSQQVMQKRRGVSGPPAQVVFVHKQAQPKTRKLPPRFLLGKAIVKSWKLAKVQKLVSRHLRESERWKVEAKIWERKPSDARAHKEIGVFFAAWHDEGWI